MNLIAMKDSIVKNLLVNVRTAFSTNVRKRINDNTRRIAMLEEVIAGLDHQMEDNYHFLHLMDYFATHKEEAQTYQRELDFLRKVGRFCNFPYPPDTEPINLVSGRDDMNNSPFVVHKGKKLFFPSEYSLNKAVGLYTNFIQNEKLLEVNDSEEAPHRYQSSNVQVQEGDVVFDIGAAEGLFSLDQIDKASHVVIVESDPLWIKPLKQTFAPYADKVTIIEKFISAVDTEKTMSLKKLLEDTNCRSGFVKMDVEGNELPAVASAVEVLKNMKGIKLAVASYHRQNDADELKALFDDLGYFSEYSNGYMLFHLYDTPLPPFFRKGIIRAKSI